MRCNTLKYFGLILMRFVSLHILSPGIMCVDKAPLCTQMLFCINIIPHTTHLQQTTLKINLQIYWKYLFLKLLKWVENFVSKCTTARLLHNVFQRSSDAFAPKCACCICVKMCLLHLRQNVPAAFAPKCACCICAKMCLLHLRQNVPTGIKWFDTDSQRKTF